MKEAEELILGIDEAGKGPVIGPMALCGCLVSSQTEKELKKLGVKDSKKLTSKRREFLAEKVREMAVSFEVVVISSNEIDEYQDKGIKLNEMEAIICAKIINNLNDKKTKIKVIIDCPSVAVLKWRESVKMKIEHLANLEILCEHKADVNYVAVSAASVLAKSKREEEMDKLKKKYGFEIGSGYTSDPNTQKFVEKYCIKYANDGIFRKCWETWQVAVKNCAQKKL
jgi:ribonuclease HII